MFAIVNFEFFENPWSSEVVINAGFMQSALGCSEASKNEAKSSDKSQRFHTIRNQDSENAIEFTMVRSTLHGIFSSARFEFDHFHRVTFDHYQIIPNSQIYVDWIRQSFYRQMTVLRRSWEKMRKWGIQRDFLHAHRRLRRANWCRKMDLDSNLMGKMKNEKK